MISISTCNSTKRTSSVVSSSPASQPTQAEITTSLTKTELRNLHFRNFVNNTSFSWSPKAAFDARETGELLTSGYETLYDYLANPQYRDAVIDVLGFNPRRLPKKDALIKVYRTADKDCGSSYGVILPGASVTSSKTSAQRHADINMKAYRLMSTDVYPDELLTHGNDNSFIYIPRSLEAGFQRYEGDMKRFVNESKAVVA